MGRSRTRSKRNDQHACMQVVHKPWGSTDLRPWSELQGDGMPVGELWFQRADPASPPPALLLKLLFTNEALSIQVHPDDAFAHRSVWRTARRRLGTFFPGSQGQKSPSD